MYIAATLSKLCDVDTAVIPPVLLTNESSSATFDCVGGTNIQWLINGSPLSNHDESIEVRAEGTRLIFEAVALELNGTVVRCVGENSVQVATGILLVQGTSIRLIRSWMIDSHVFSDMYTHTVCAGHRSSDITHVYTYCLCWP